MTHSCSMRPVQCRVQTRESVTGADPSPSLSCWGFCSVPSQSPQLCPLSLQFENCILKRKGKEKQTKDKVSSALHGCCWPYPASPLGLCSGLAAHTTLSNTVGSGTKLGQKLLREETNMQLPKVTQHNPGSGFRETQQMYSLRGIIVFNSLCKTSVN